MTTTIDHGVFTPYDDPTDAANILHMRDERGRDWYAVVNTAPQEPVWLLANPASGEIIAATDDPSKLAPVGARVLSTSGDPPASFIGKTWNGAGFIDKPAPPVTTITRRQCALELRAREMASDAEAIALVANGALTLRMSARLSRVPPEKQLEAQIDAAIDPYRIENANLCALLIDDDKLDAFFAAAAKR